MPRATPSRLPSPALKFQLQRPPVHRSGPPCPAQRPARRLARFSGCPPETPPLVAPNLPAFLVARSRNARRDPESRRSPLAGLPSRRCRLSGHSTLSSCRDPSTLYIGSPRLRKPGIHALDAAGSPPVLLFGHRQSAVSALDDFACTIDLRLCLCHPSLMVFACTTYREA